MNRLRIHLLTFQHIPIYLDFSWFLLLTLLLIFLSTGYFPVAYPLQPGWVYWLLGAVASLLLFACILLHEIGHSLLARRYRLRVRGIVLFVFGGVAHIAGEPPGAMAELWISLAGPVVSASLGMMCKIIAWIFHSISPVAVLFQYLAVVNFIIAVFNLIPGFPLDGGRILRAVLWGVSRNFFKATLVAANIGRLFAFIFILLGTLMIFSGHVLNGLWAILIGLFLESAATSQAQQTHLHWVLAHHKIAEIMNTDYPRIDAHCPVQQVVEEHLLGAGRRMLVVMENGRGLGVLTPHCLRQVPPEQRATTRVKDVMLPWQKLHVVKPEDDLWTALTWMDKHGVNQLPVLREGEVVGILSRADLISFLRTLHLLIL